MDFNFWSSPLIKGIEKGELPVIKTEVNLSEKTTTVLIIMLIVIVLTIIITKKLSK